jgi:hypothetical protein
MQLKLHTHTCNCETTEIDLPINERESCTKRVFVRTKRTMRALSKPSEHISKKLSSG